MDRRAQTTQNAAAGNSSTQPGAGADARPTATTPGGTPLTPDVQVGPTFVRTVRHFFPNLNQWLDDLPDSRDQDILTFPRRFLGWWGILLYVLQLGSRRQLDFDLRADGTQVLHNVNRLAETDMKRRPVHDTLDYFLEHSGPAGLERLRSRLNQRLLRHKVLDSARVLGHVAMITDGTGHLAFGKKHCDQCLQQRHDKHTYYLHQVLEAKFVGPGGFVTSVGSAFIENEPGWQQLPADERKQNCELKAVQTLAPAVKRDYPQLKICWLGDSLCACGRSFQIAREQGWNFVFTFKEGRTPALWHEFQTLLPQVPHQVVRHELPDGTVREYRWVNQLDYVDSVQRAWKLNALQCLETPRQGKPTRWAWLTRLPLNRNTVVEVAEHGGRARWLIENQGFNRQKNSGMQLEHVYSIDAEKLKAYYLLLQIAHLLLLLLEQGSLLRRLVADWGKTVRGWFGSLKNIAKRLLESLRGSAWPAESFARPSGRQRVVIDTS